MIVYREYCPEDCCFIAKLFYETVHIINAKDYTQQPQSYFVWKLRNN